MVTTLPDIIAVEPTAEKLLLPTVAQRLALPPRSTPALERFGEQALDEYIPSFEVIGDGIIGLTVNHPYPTPLAKNRAHLAIENHVCLAVPKFNNVITRGTERPTHRIRTYEDVLPYYSPELIDENLEFMNKITIPDGESVSSYLCVGLFLQVFVEAVGVGHSHLVDGLFPAGNPVSYTHLTLPTNREV